LAALIYTLSKHAETLKDVIPHDPSFGKEVLGYLQKSLSDAESKSECTTESEHNTKCAEAE
jgi:hypothetical protein